MYIFCSTREPRLIDHVRVFSDNIQSLNFKWISKLSIHLILLRTLNINKVNITNSLKFHNPHGFLFFLQNMDASISILWHQISKHKDLVVDAVMARSSV